MRSVFYLLLFAVVFGSCQSDPSAEKIPSSVTPPSIRPPLPEADVPFNYFEIDADKGDTVFAASGSILVFPAHSLVDNKGKPVTGKVSIRFREFADALDQYLAGIPITFDSAGGKIQFVSSGMCEIKALKDNQPVFMNSDRKPTTHLLSTNANINDQLYYFDTVSNRWIADGKITTIYPDRKPAITKKKTPVLATTPALITPVLPVQATGNSPVLKVKIDPGSFGEFSRFNNLRFQVDEMVRKFDPKDADEEWNDVSLERAAQPGKYILKFSNASRSVSYVARPVLEGNDLEKAKVEYEKELAIFNQKLTDQRVQIERAKKQLREDSLKQDVANKIQDELALQLDGLIKEKNARIEAQNKIIAEQNIRTEKANRDIALRAQIREAENKVRDSLQQVAEEKNKVLGEEPRTPVKMPAPVAAKEVAKEVDQLAKKKALEVERVYRSFNANRLGWINIDIVQPLTFFAVTPDFRDEAGNKLNLKQVGTTIQGMNGAIIMDGDVVTLVEGAGMTLWGVVDDRLAFLDGKSYQALKITPAIKQVTLVMRLIPVGRNNYEYVRAFIGQRPLP